MKTSDLRLGMPYFQVAAGKIEIKLVKSLSFKDQDDVNSAVIIDGKMSMSEFQLARNWTHTHNKAVASVDSALRDSSRTVQQDEVLRKRHQKLLEDLTGQEELWIGSLAEVTPLEHFPLGTMLWYAEPGRWQLVKGPLVQLDMFDLLSVYGCPQYKNGQFPDVTHTSGFFDSEAAALDSHEAEFRKRLPGRLVRSEVKTIQTATYAERLTWHE